MEGVTPPERREFWSTSPFARAHSGVAGCPMFDPQPICLRTRALRVVTKLRKFFALGPFLLFTGCASLLRELGNLGTCLGNLETKGKSIWGYAR